MNARTLKIVLAASVALNLFALGVGATLLVNRERAEAVTEDGRRTAMGNGRSEPVGVLIGRLDEGRQDQVRQELRNAARAARPDFEAARQARREALAAATAETYDAAAIAALLETSRAAEMRGRERLETNAVEVLGGLSLEDRRTLSQILSRKGGGGGGGGRGHHERRPEGAAPKAD